MIKISIHQTLSNLQLSIRHFSAGDTKFAVLVLKKTLTFSLFSNESLS